MLWTWSEQLLLTCSGLLWTCSGLLWTCSGSGEAGDEERKIQNHPPALPRMKSTWWCRGTATKGLVQALNNSMSWYLGNPKRMHSYT